MNINYPERYKHLANVDNLASGWDKVVMAIRPDYREVAVITKAQKAMEAGLYDAAINYFWNLVIHDLHTKITTYGISYFSDAINWNGKPLRKLEDLREVKDHQVLSGAFTLGIISQESYFYLEQCRGIRNNFSTAHLAMGELDRLETSNFIKNCVKHALTFDPPAPGMQIKELIEAMTEEQLDDVQELVAMIDSQSSKIHGAILHNLFSQFLKQDCPGNLKHNIRLLAPHVWELVSDEVKSGVAGKFGSLKEVKGMDGASEALTFLKIVDGVSYMPETFKDIVFKKHAQSLIDTHYSQDNFYHEPGFAHELAALGPEVPVSAMDTYVKAVLLSYLGNPWGYARGAVEPNVFMLEKLSQSGIRVLFKLLSNDRQIIRTLTDYKPASRLKDLMEIIKEKTMLPPQREFFDFVVASNTEKLKKEFDRRFWALVEKEEGRRKSA